MTEKQVDVLSGSQIQRKVNEVVGRGQSCQFELGKRSVSDCANEAKMR